MIPTDGVVK